MKIGKTELSDFRLTDSHKQRIGCQSFLKNLFSANDLNDKSNRINNKVRKKKFNQID